MAAPIGNQFWKMRTKHGRDRLFADPDTLWAACCEYFEWVEANPLIEHQPFAYQGVVNLEPVPKMRAMTLEGLYFFLRIGSSTWFDWRNQEGFSEVVREAEAVIRDQKFTGAAAGFLSANIIARDLGLADKQTQVATVTHNIMPVPTCDSAEEWEAAAATNQDGLLGRE